MSKIHKKEVVERGSTFDEATRGPVSFGVDKDDKTQPVKIGPHGSSQSEDFVLYDLLQGISKRLDILIAHMELHTDMKITGEDL